MNIKLLGNRVLIKSIEENKTASGLIIQKSNEGGDYLMGQVVTVGPGKRLDESSGKEYVYIDLNVGDNVIYQYGAKVSVEGAEYVLVNSDDIIAII